MSSSVIFVFNINIKNNIFVNEYRQSRKKKKKLFRKYITREKLFIFRIEKIELLNLTLNITKNYKRDTKI